MGREELISQVRDYRPWNEQEAADRIEILRQLESCRDIFLRDNRAAHMSASAWVVNRERSKALMVFHNIYNSWSWTGGHADGETDLLSVAIREVREETGVYTVHPVSENIFSLEILTVDGHEKRGVYVPSHLHLNLTWLLEADEAELTHQKEDENSAVAWFPLDEAVQASSEPWMRERVYAKLNAKLEDFTLPLQ